MFVAFVQISPLLLVFSGEFFLPSAKDASSLRADFLGSKLDSTRFPLLSPTKKKIFEGKKGKKSQSSVAAAKDVFLDIIIKTRDLPNCCLKTSKQNLF